MTQNSMKFFFSLLLLAAVFFAAWAFFPEREKREQKDQPNIVAATYPLAYFSQRIAGDDLHVHSLLPSGVEAHGFSPRPSDIEKILASDLFVYNGAGFDLWAEELSTSLGIQEHSLEVGEYLNLLENEDQEHEEEEDRHEPEEAGHQDGAKDPHFWLDPLIAIEAVEVLTKELVQLAPEKEAVLRERAEDLKEQLRSLHQDYQQGLAQCEQESIFVAHDAFNYPAFRYGFSIVPIAGLSPHDEPSVRRLTEIADLAEQSGADTIFFEELASPRLSRTIADEIGAQTKVLHPIENLTREQKEEGKDYFSLMRENLDHLRLAMKCR